VVARIRYSDVPFLAATYDVLAISEARDRIYVIQTSDYALADDHSKQKDRHESIQ